MIPATPSVRCIPQRLSAQYISQTVPEQAMPLIFRLSVMNETPQPDESFDDRPSKSARKRAMHALQDMGDELAALTKTQLAKLELPESLRIAIKEAQRMPPTEARRRQMQYVGKLMRSVDPEPLRLALDEIRGVGDAHTARQKALERLRDELIEDESILTALVAEHPGLDVPLIRQLRRNAIKEKAESRPPRAYRELFRVLRDLTEPKTPNAEPPNASLPNEQS